MHVSQETAEECWHSNSPAVRYGHSSRTAPNPNAIRAAEDLRVNHHWPEPRQGQCWLSLAECGKCLV